MPQSRNRERVTISLRPHVRDALSDLAAREDLSVSRVCDHLLEKALKGDIR